jgi:cytochrome c oxidase subunit 1
MSSSRYQPEVGESLWLVATFLSSAGMLLVAGTVLWTVLAKRIRGMSMFRIPPFAWAMIATCLLAIAGLPSLLAADALVAVSRIHADIMFHDTWVIGYQNLFWFYGHPIVYVMFFPYVGAIDEVLATFSGRRFFGYKINALSLLAFAALSMSVWGHHMFTTGEDANDYFTFTSIAIIVPAGVEYFDYLATVMGGRLRYTTPMLFALAFIPQFLIGGITGIMTGTTVLDFQFHGSYFVVAHFHYTLLAGSFFGLLAGFYYWFPKMTGFMLNEKLGKVHFWLMLIGTNVTFLPMFWLGMKGMPRRIARYLPSDGFTMLNEIASVGAGILAVAMSVFVFNLVHSMLRKLPAGDNPWGGFTLEWATTSPPPKLNFHPGSIPPITSFAPLLDKKLRDEEQKKQPAGARRAGAREEAET